MRGHAAEDLLACHRVVRGEPDRRPGEEVQRLQLCALLRELTKLLERLVRDVPRKWLFRFATITHPASRANVMDFSSAPCFANSPSFWNASSGMFRRSSCSGPRQSPSRHWERTRLTSIPLPASQIQRAFGTLRRGCCAHTWPFLPERITHPPPGVNAINFSSAPCFANSPSFW